MAIRGSWKVSIVRVNANLEYQAEAARRNAEDDSQVSMAHEPKRRPNFRVTTPKATNMSKEDNPIPSVVYRSSMSRESLRIAPRPKWKCLYKDCGKRCATRYCLNLHIKASQHGSKFNSGNGVSSLSKANLEYTAAKAAAVDENSDIECTEWQCFHEGCEKRCSTLNYLNAHI